MTAIADGVVDREPPAVAAPASGEWVLSVPLDDVWGASLRGARFLERGAWKVFVDGLLYDRSELAASVGAPSTSSNDELVLAACERWGASAITRLRGAFSVAVIDRARDTAFVARDPLGMHPLFYAQSGGSVSYASEPQRLFKYAGISSAPNRVALADHLCLRWPLADETFFQHVRRVRPGWQAVVHGGALRLERHWIPWEGADSAEWLTDAEVARFDEHLDRAVNRGLSLGKSGIFLSGGLDSISVAAVASDQSRRAGLDAPLALSLGFPDPECDEQAVQSAVAARLGLPHRLLLFGDAVGPRGLLAQALELNRGLASPILNTWAPAYLTLARAGRAEGLETILTGTGGDEWLAVSPFLAADFMRRGDLAGLAHFGRVWYGSQPHSPARVLHSVVWRFGLRPLVGTLLYRMAPNVWDDSRKRRALGADPAWISSDADLRAAQGQRARDSLVPADPAGGFYQRELRFGIEQSLISWEMEEQHELGRRSGVTFVHPYWDADLVTMLYRTHPKHLMQGGRSKGLVRATVARRFPGLGFERQRKVAATSFYRRILRTEGPGLVRALGDMEALVGLGIVDADRVRTAVRGVFESPVEAWYRLWQLVNVETWVRQYA